MTTITFEVVGLPAPQGSKRHVGNGIMRESSKALAPWRDSVAAAARDCAGPEPMTGPLSLTVHFRHPMPKSRKAAVRAAGIAPKVSAPDLDKLVRAVGDALTASGLIRDDALICEIHASKAEVIGWTGAIVTVTDEVPSLDLCSITGLHDPNASGICRDCGAIARDPKGNCAPDVAYPVAPDPIAETA